MRDTVQKEVLDRIINWDVKFVLPMAGESGNPSVSGLVSTTAAAASRMMLSCAPAILAIMRGGPSKASAETLAWTMGAPPPDARHAPPAARRLASPAHPSRPLRDRARAQARPWASSTSSRRSRRRAPSGARAWLLCTSE